MAAPRRARARPTARLGARDEARVPRDEHARLDDLGLGSPALGPQAPAQVLELARGLLQRRGDDRRIDRTGRGGSVEHARGAHRDPRRRREPGQHPLGHQASPATARWSARTTSAADVAPGSWCPIERSPR